ncbi:metal-dependent transcriptional regulator [Pseudactinotalea sp. Z1739]|uniref:metal-dependent transcriptional regulator n=1 Tax=Pseudactinotalea sp. Z1739 TaxID=3413028 RepID=UPI003C7B45D4
MHIDSLTRMAQDYLRTIFKVQEWHPGPVAVNELAERMGVAASTASGNVRKLVADGLVAHKPYGGVELTPAGRRAAVQMARRHRLLETFLVERLGYSWDEVHDEAEHLEHAASDTFIERIEEDLGFPTHDPHGDAIPDRDGVMVATSARMLSEVESGACGTIARISDDDPAVLRYLTGHGIEVGTHLRVHDRQEGAGVVRIVAEPLRAAGGDDKPAERTDLGMVAARTIWLAADSHRASIRP